MDDEKAVEVVSTVQMARPLSPIDSTAEQKSIKALEINAAYISRNVARLTELATEEHGLINDELRKLVWPLLLGCPSSIADGASKSWEKLPRHRDEDQVSLDVNRSFVYYPSNESDSTIRVRRQGLQDLIVETLRRHPFLCYFQGYHDIVQVLLLVLGREEATDAVARLSMLRIRDFMLPTIGPSISHLRLLPSLLKAADAEVAEHLSHTEPFFALAATITLYAHDIQEYGDIARLYDFLLSREAVVSIYLFAVIIVSRRAELLEIEHDEPEMLHSVLSKLPKPLDLEKLISKTMALFKKYPPRSLSSFRWPWISSNSVLRTTGDHQALAKQTLEDGRRFFFKQTREIRVLESLSRVRSRMWSARRPAAAVSIAVFVAVLSYWIRRDSSSSIFEFAWSRSRLFHRG